MRLDNMEEKTNKNITKDEIGKIKTFCSKNVRNRIIYEMKF